MKPTEIPTLTTERLRLVPTTEAHLDGETAFWTTDRSKFVGGPVPAHRVWRILAIWRGHWELRGYGSWSVELRDGTHIGFCGIWHPGEWPEPEIGYHIFDGFEGKGYVTEAVLEARRFAYEVLGFDTITSFIDPDNAASEAVARRVGAVPTDQKFRANPDDPEVVIWRHPAPEDAR